MSSILLRLCDERFYITLESLCLSYCSLDSLVEDEGSRHVGEQRLTVTALATKVIDCFIVPHIT